jgi:hypothetical protein
MRVTATSIERMGQPESPAIKPNSPNSTAKSRVASFAKKSALSFQIESTGAAVRASLALARGV